MCARLLVYFDLLLRGQEDVHGFQPLLRELRLAVAYEFPNPQFHSRPADGRRLGVAVLNMKRNDSQWHVITLADAIQHTRCGWIFGGNNPTDRRGEADDNKYVAALTAARRDNDERVLRSLRVPGSYEAPTVEAAKTIRNAKAYTEMYGWRDVPPGANTDGGKAVTVGGICVAQLPSAYLVGGAKAYVRAHSGGVLGEAIGLGEDADRARIARIQPIVNTLNQDFGLTLVAAKVPKIPRRGPVNTPEETKRWLDTYYKALTTEELPGFAAQATGGIGERILGLLPDSPFERLHQWDATLASLAKVDENAHRSILKTIEDRVKPLGDDIARIDTHIRHVIAGFEKMGLSLGTAPKQAVPGEALAQFVASLPSPASLATSKIVPRSATGVPWAKASSLGAGLDVAGKEDDAFSDATQRFTDLAPMLGGLSDAELITLIIFLTRPFTLETCVAMARIGVPIITGSIERWAQTFRCLSMLVLKSDEVCQTIMTPMRATLSSEGVRRITHFTFDFLMGQRWLNPDALVELPNMFPAEFIGGMNHRLIGSLDEFHKYLKGVNYTTRADCIFVPRSVGEMTVEYPGNLFGEMWQKPDRMVRSLTLCISRLTPWPGRRDGAGHVPHSQWPRLVPRVHGRSALQPLGANGGSGAHGQWVNVPRHDPDCRGARVHEEGGRSW